MLLSLQQDLRPKLTDFLQTRKHLVMITTLHQVLSTDLDGKTP